MGIRYKGKEYGSLSELNSQIPLQEWLEVETDKLEIVSKAFYRGKLLVTYVLETDKDMGFLVTLVESSRNMKVLGMYIF